MLTVIQLNAQIDQLTAQAAQASGDQEAVSRQIAAIQQERDQLRAQGEDLSRQLQEAKQRENQLRDQLSKVEPDAETGSLQKIAGAAANASTEPERATAMLTLAMQLHDQYVDKGKATANELKEQAQRDYDELIAKAEEYSKRTHNEADSYSQQVRQQADIYAQQSRSEADSYSAKTRQDADSYMNGKHTEADQYEAEVQRRSAEYDQQTRSAADEYAQQVRVNLATQSKVVEGNIQGLKQFETEYRARLTEFLSQLMSQVSDTNNYDKTEQPAQ